MWEKARNITTVDDRKTAVLTGVYFFYRTIVRMFLPGCRDPLFVFRVPRHPKHQKTHGSPMVVFQVAPCMYQG